MSLIRCGTDENGSYIELKRPRGETPLCFIDECGEIIPEGSMVCDRCREAVEEFE